MIGIIYEIVCNNLEIMDRYIGSTIRFQKRLILHKSRSGNINGACCNNTLYNFIRNNGGWDNFTMNKLEEYIFEDVIDLKQRERLYYEVYEPSLNERAPYVRLDQYNAYRYNLQKTNALIYRKKYYDANRELILKKARDYAMREDVKLKKSEYNKQYALLNKDRLKAIRVEKALIKKQKNSIM